jgi:cytoskeleton protein RodZ
MASVGSELKSEREKRNISLSQIAADTRISLRHLESLEEGRYKDLPGGMYNRAFLRAYCESLHLDQQELMRQYEAEISPLTDKAPKSKTRIPPKQSSFRFSSVILWSLMLLVSATGLFFSREWIAEVFYPYFSHSQTTNARFSSPTHPAVSSIETSVAEASSSNTLPIISPPDVSSASSAVSVPVPLSTSETPTPPTKIPVGGESIEALTNSAKALRLEIAGTEKCWISIDRDGQPAIRKLLEPGEVHTFAAAEKFLLILGNAGGVQLKINGKPAKPLGKSGEVIKLIIDEKNLSALIDQSAG